MPRKPVADKALQLKRHRLRTIAVVLLLLISIGLIITVILLEKADAPVAFYARDINDASYDCEDKINRYYEEDLVSKVYDDYSSRYEADKRQYIIFYRVSVNTEMDGYPTVVDYMIKCVVWERLGYVSDFQVLNFFNVPKTFGR